jgi:hypothetical protein
MPGIAIRCVRRSNSAKLRRSIGGTLPSGDDTDSSMISPVIEVIGVISACASVGSAPRAAASFSATSVRAR